MPKPFKSQWEFGELFPPEQLRKVLSVTELTWQIKRLLEEKVGEVWVTGEVTNLRSQSSGHIYFTLKDADAQLSCVLFRGEPQVDRSLLQDGRKVTLRGEVTVYEPRGQYQLRVTKVELQGIGALQVAFEKLKQKLKAEGLFATERKRPLPRYPQRIGLVTSPTGAAIRDVLHVVERRNPSLEIILAPCRVQGEGAAMEIAQAIRLLNEFDAAQSAIGDRRLAIDLILVTRGGGSLEDLWAFNEEVVARAIFESALPVVSAVGHEIDFTISDFVADLRAATPSAAAEIITEGVFASCQFVSEAAARIRQLARQPNGGQALRAEPNHAAPGAGPSAPAAQRVAAAPRRRADQPAALCEAGGAAAAAGLAESLGPAGAGAPGVCCCGNGARCSARSSAACRNRCSGYWTRGGTLLRRSKAACACSAPSRCWLAAIPSPPTPRPGEVLREAKEVKIWPAPEDPPQGGRSLQPWRINCTVTRLDKLQGLTMQPVNQVGGQLDAGRAWGFGLACTCQVLRRTRARTIPPKPDRSAV